MEKNIKDYLHLYLGCEVLVLDLDGQTFKDKIEDVFDRKHGKGFSIYEFGDCPFDDHDEYYQEIKPILRPLSDMTKEEREYVRVKFNHGSAESFIWHLSKHFDLFGLIEAGLAIDKTKML